MGEGTSRTYTFAAPKPVVPSFSNMTKSVAAGSILIGLSLFQLGLPSWPQMNGEELFTLGTVAVVFLLSMLTLISFEYRSRPLMISLADLPLVISLLMLQAWPVVLVRAAALFIAATVQRKSLHRTVFNTGLLVAETALGYALIGLAGTLNPAEPNTWFVVIATIFVLNLFSMMVIVAYASLLDGVWPSFEGVGVSLLTLVGAGFACSITGILGTLSLKGSLWAAPFMAFTIYALAAVFKARHEIAQRSNILQDFRRATAHNNCTEEDVMMALMRQSCSMIHANQAKLTVHPHGSQEKPHIRARRALPFWPLASSDTDDTLVAVLSREDGTKAVLEISQKRPELGRLTNRDLDAVTVIVGHAESTWRGTFLVEKMRHEARHDSITAIGNRDYLIGELEQATSPGTVAMVGCLTMPKVITAFGVAVADDLMVFIAQRLAHCADLDPALRVARTGDETFSIWLPTGHESALSDIQAALARPLKHGTTTISMGYAFGYTETTPDTPAQAALHQAHTAMVAAAQSKSESPVGFDGSYVARTRDRLALSEDLRAALATGGITLSFQPKISARTGRVKGCEALARWAHPRHGIIPPNEFVPLAEQTDQIKVLTQHMLRKATEACSAWQDTAPGVGVSVNVSTVDLSELDFVDLVDEVLCESGLPSDLLTIEVTETDMMNDTVTVVATLSRLQSRGVQISVDDFGTGYSSLSYIRNLPIDEAKIDKSFIMSLETDSTGQELVSNIISLIHTLGVNVVAEGVESTMIGEYLADVSCDVLQGYGISWPLSLDSLLVWLEQKARRHNVDPTLTRILNHDDNHRTVVLPADPEPRALRSTTRQQ